MACASCGRNKKGNGYIQPESLQFYPFNSNDIQVYDGQDVRRLTKDDWAEDRHKLILFIPEANTPVCESELGNLNQWVDEFKKLDCDIFAASTDPIHALKDWIDNEEMLKDPKYKVISTYLLPTRLNIMNNGRAMRASVLITKDSDVVVQQHFMKVGRSLKELHRMLYAYTTGSYCAEGWESPEDGFVVGKDDNKTP